MKQYDHQESLKAAAKRNTAIVKERKAGATYSALGKKYNISRARAEQICRRYSKEEA
jgi:Mor family transcriptional regulator